MPLDFPVPNKLVAEALASILQNQGWEDGISSFSYFPYGKGGFSKRRRYRYFLYLKDGGEEYDIPYHKVNEEGNLILPMVTIIEAYHIRNLLQQMDMEVEMEEKEINSRSKFRVVVHIEE